MLKILYKTKGEESIVQLLSQKKEDRKPKITKNTKVLKKVINVLKNL